MWSGHLKSTNEGKNSETDIIIDWLWDEPFSNLFFFMSRTNLRPSLDLCFLEEVLVSGDWPPQCPGIWGSYSIPSTCGTVVDLEEWVFRVSTFTSCYVGLLFVGLFRAKVSSVLALPPQSLRASFCGLSPLLWVSPALTSERVSCPAVTILRLCLIVGIVPGRNWVWHVHIAFCATLPMSWVSEMTGNNRLAPASGKDGSLVVLRESGEAMRLLGDILLTYCDSFL